MGIFADFLASRPMMAPVDRTSRREIETLRDQGDSEAPAGFSGRTGWAILKVLGLTTLTTPPTQGFLLGYLPQNIDYQRAPISSDTAKIIASQISIDDGNADLERDVLIHLTLCPSQPGDVCLNASVKQVKPLSPGNSWDFEGTLSTTSATFAPTHGSTNMISTVNNEFVAGKLGTAVRCPFSGANLSSAIDLVNNPINSFHMTGWYKRVTDDFPGQIFVLQEGSSQTVMSLFHWNATAFPNSGPGINFELQDASNTFVIETNFVMSLGVWYFIDMFLNTDTNQMGIGINNSIPLVKAFPGPLIDPSGQVLNLADGSTGQGFDYDAIAVWDDVVLSQDNRAWLYNNGNGNVI